MSPSCTCMGSRVEIGLVHPDHILSGLSGSDLVSPYGYGVKYACGTVMQKWTPIF